MARMVILTEPDLRGIIDLDSSAVACIEEAFRTLATRPVVMPPILRLDIKERRGEVDVKTAYVPGLDTFAIKVSPGFFDNPKLGLPSVNGLMVVLSAKTGLVEALLLDNGYLTDIRTAAAGAVAAKVLSREDSGCAMIFGAGIQARLQLRALTLVRPIRRAFIWARDPGKAVEAARDCEVDLGFPVSAARSPEEACREADIIVTTTPAETPILDADWIRPGQHVTAMGSDAEHKNEVDPRLVARSDFVVDSLAQARRLGELHHAIRLGLAAPDRSFPELGQVIAGRAPGRTGPDAVTLCDLTGMGVQDTAIASLARQRAASAGAGRTINTNESSGGTP